MRLLQIFVASAMVSATIAPASALDAVGEGRRAWLKYNCYGCHGGNGGGGMGPNVQHQSYGDVSGAMSGGERDGGMRSYSGIATSTDAYNIAQYLATIGLSSEPKWLDWWKLTAGTR